MCPVQLSKFNNSRYDPGRPLPIQILWYFVGRPLLRCWYIPTSGPRRVLLRLFGSKVGKRVVIRPGIRIKFPWYFEIGDDSWIGEDVWIDNLAPVRIGSNACISQGAYLCTGNHDWTDPAFGLLVRPIIIGDGGWVGAKATVCPGVEVGECAVAAAGSVVTSNLAAYTIHGGNPAVPIKVRTIHH